MLNVIIKQTYQHMDLLKSNTEVSKAIFDAAGIKHENPLKYYIMLTSIEKNAAISCVFNCERLIDRKKFAMKLAEPKCQ